MSAALGRLRLRRVAFARLTRIRKQHVFRLVDDAPKPVESRPRRQLAPYLERILLGEDTIPPPWPELAERENPQFSELSMLAVLVRLNGGDPEGILRGWLEQQKPPIAARLLTSIERESRIRKRAAEIGSLKVARAEDERATGEKSETHRRNLGRDFNTLVSLGYIERIPSLPYLLSVLDPEKKSPLWANVAGEES